MHEDANGLGRYWLWVFGRIAGNISFAIISRRRSRQRKASRETRLPPRSVATIQTQRVRWNRETRDYIEYADRKAVSNMSSQAWCQQARMEIVAVFLRRLPGLRKDRRRGEDPSNTQAEFPSPLCSNERRCSSLHTVLV
jgi:hypothetical protein